MEILKRVKKYIIVTFIGLLLTICICWIKQFSFQMEEVYKYKILSDATFFSAVILLGIGLMISAASNFGLFIAVSYSIKRFFTIVSKQATQNRGKILSYYEYRKMKLENDISGRYMYITGIGFLLISVIFTVMYYK